VDEALYRLHAEREGTYWWWVAKNRIILSLIERYFWRGRAGGTGPFRALDVGCGAGGVLARLARRFDAVGVDMSPIAREYCARRGLIALDGALPDAMPLGHPAFREGFDVIVASEVIEHIREDRASVAALVRLLKPGGVIVCTVPAHMWLWSSHDDFNHHRRRYTRSQFGALFDGLPVRTHVLSCCQMCSMPLVAAGRAVEKIRTRITGKPPPEPEVTPLPGPVNWALTKAFESEKFWLPHAGLPWGTSVISVHGRDS